MQYISSDTNIWFDFYMVSCLDIPFKLPCTFIMFGEALRKEIIHPPGLISELQEKGLQAVDIDTEEFYLAEELRSKYRKISVYDSIALSIAKSRGILLVTGDNALRQAALKESVKVQGTIGLLDSVYEKKLIGRMEYISCLERFKEHPERRLPVDEIEKRLKMEKRKGDDAYGD